MAPVTMATEAPWRTTQVAVRKTRGVRRRPKVAKRARDRSIRARKIVLTEPVHHVLEQWFAVVKLHAVGTAKAKRAGVACCREDARHP